MIDDGWYADRASRLDTLAGPDKAAYWRMLARLTDQWAGPKDPVFGMTKEWNTFGTWCETVHGFRPEYDEGGGITGQPIITDKRKYLVCVLKYSG